MEMEAMLPMKTDLSGGGVLGICMYSSASERANGSLRLVRR